MTICMNMSRFINLAAIFSLDLESQCMSCIRSRSTPSNKVGLFFAHTYTFPFLCGSSALLVLAGREAHWD